MFAVFLRFGENRHRAPELMAGHNAWLNKGFEDGVFLLAGSVLPAEGGMVLAHSKDRTALAQRFAEDPFVAEGVVTVEVHEISPARVDERLAFLTAD